MRRKSIVAGFMMAITVSAAPAPRKSSSSDCVVLGHTIPNCDLVAYLKSLGIVDVPLVGDLHHEHGSNTTTYPSHNTTSDDKASHDNTGSPEPHHNATNSHEPHAYNNTSSHSHNNTTKHTNPYNKNNKLHKRASFFTNLLNYYKQVVNNLIQKVYLPELKSTTDNFVKSANNSTATTRLNGIQGIANAIDIAVSYLGLGGKGSTSGMTSSQKSNFNATLTNVLDELKGLNGTNATLSNSQRAQLARLESSLQRSLGKFALEKRDGRSIWENA